MALRGPGTNHVMPEPAADRLDQLRLRENDRARLRFLVFAHGLTACCG